jgi:hypothetical protein
MKNVNWLILIGCHLIVCFGSEKIALGQSQNVQRCSGAYDSAQVEMRAGKLISAKQKLVFCLSSECPDIMHSDCQEWLNNVENSLSTVVIRVESMSAQPVINAIVTVDGGPPVQVNGRAMQFDPGQHELRFSAPEFKSKIVVMLFAEGEKLRQERILLDPARPETELRRAEKSNTVSPLDTTSTRINWTVPIVVGASVTTLGALGAIYFGEKARSADRALDDCTPNCDRDRIDRIKREYLFANTSLGVMFVGAAATASFFVFDTLSKKTSPVSYVRLDATLSKFAFSLDGRF